MKLTGRFEVPDHNAVQLAESEWQHLRTEANEKNWPHHQAIVEAAYHQPALRRLYPFTSHWTLRFAITTRPNFPRPGVPGGAPGQPVHRPRSPVGRGTAR